MIVKLIYNVMLKTIQLEKNEKPEIKLVTNLCRREKD